VVIERTKDWELIKRIVTDKSVYSKVSDDESPAAKDWQPSQHEQAYYLLVKNGIDELGIFYVAPQNGVTYQVHTCLLPHAYGPKAAVAAKELLDWVFENTNCERLVTEIPEYNSLALRFALKAGMEKYGYNPKSFKKDGVLHGVMMLGISKGKSVCQ
jgi:RimJ/RimL family protein N-acetyltransferase